MAPPTTTPTPQPPRQVSRARILVTGLLLGAALGVAMCLLLWAVGRLEWGDTQGWMYRIDSTALRGMVVSTIVGPVRTARAEGTLAPRRRLFGRRRS